MKFDKSRVYSMANANELEIGSKVYVADDLETLQKFVESDRSCDELIGIRESLHKDDDDIYSFIIDADDDNVYAYAYLIEPPTKLKWQDLKIGDVIRSKKSGIEYMVIATSSCPVSAGSHVATITGWISDEMLSNFEKDKYFKL